MILPCFCLPFQSQMCQIHLHIWDPSGTGKNDKNMARAWYFYLLFEPSNTKNIDFMKCICLSLDWRMDWETRKILADWSRASGQTYGWPKYVQYNVVPWERWIDRGFSRKYHSARFCKKLTNQQSDKRISNRLFWSFAELAGIANLELKNNKGHHTLL